MLNKNKPIHEVRLGSIKAAVWKNETETGVRYNVTFSRLYRDGDKWRTTESFGRDDLLLLAKVANQTHSWIFAQGRSPDQTGETKPEGERTTETQSELLRERSGSNS